MRSRRGSGSGTGGTRPALLDGSAVGYALLVRTGTAYGVPAARGVVGGENPLPLAGVRALVVFLYVSRTPDRFE